MSEKQFGYGYWCGVEDAKNGIYGSYSEKAVNCADSIILSIVEFEENGGSKDVKKLNDVIKIFCSSVFYKKESKKTIMSALNYIWKKEPYGFYIGGENGRFLDLENDFLVSSCL